MTGDAPTTATLSAARSFAASEQPTKSLLLRPGWRIRPYEGCRDLVALQEICKHVYNGQDYLPATAAEYEADPRCHFVALVQVQNDVDKERLLAVANLRMLDEQTGWLEAVRTHPRHRGQGCATAVMKYLVQQLASTDNYMQVWSCTYQGNAGIQHVFEHKLRMKPLGGVAMLDPKQLQDRLEEYNNNNLSTRQTPSLLELFQLHDAIPPLARQAEWQTIRDIPTLATILAECGKTNGHGLLPNWWKLSSPQTCPQLQTSLLQGLVFALLNVGEEKPSAVAAVLYSPDTHPDLPWLLCVAGSTRAHLQAALWHVHASSAVPTRLEQCKQSHKKKAAAILRLAVDNGMVPPLPSSESMQQLPWRTDYQNVLYHGTGTEITSLSS